MNWDTMTVPSPWRIRASCGTMINHQRIEIIRAITSERYSHATGMASVRDQFYQVLLYELDAIRKAPWWTRIFSYGTGKPNLNGNVLTLVQPVNNEKDLQRLDQLPLVQNLKSFFTVLSKRPLSKLQYMSGLANVEAHECKTTKGMLFWRLTCNVLIKFRTWNQSSLMTYSQRYESTAYGPGKWKRLATFLRHVWLALF
ncbi:hypothetical protein Zm00014a_014960 [Zea mays]|uniref:Uncharacterized protein n=1 Tax=Zea mays TaxID=4577 RepID=A0A3L6EK91_MAIZE|nr:hypothetical protein Zm00014a_014960 [Zea mays]